MLIAPQAADAVRLHLSMQCRYNRVLSTTTIGFAVADEDRERLDRLVAQFGGATGQRTCGLPCR